MLRIIQNQHVAGAKSYYSTGAYYAEGQDMAGNWRGKGAALLGLQGPIDQREWDALCDQLDPRSGESLVQRRKDNRTVGYDFNFHVPKSVSVLYERSQDDRILDAFRESVNETMQDIESEMQTRVRKDGKNEDRTTGNMIWGEFVHRTARPVDGVPDPHLHAHCFVHNLTWDSDERAWKAGQFRDLKRDAPYFEAMFQARFAQRMADLGLTVERKGRKDWEIAGVPHSVIEKFSRRTKEIEQKAKELGIDDPDAIAELGAKTRRHKAKNLTMQELRAEWRSRLSDSEAEAMRRVEEQLGGQAEPADGYAAGRAVEFALSHHFERQSVVPERVLLTTALRQAVGKGTVVQVQRAFDGKQLLTHDRGGRRWATTRDVLDEESRILAFARNGRGACRALGRKGRTTKRTWLNASQQSAVRHILESRDRVTMIHGAAGVGKTSLMQEAVEAIEENGTKVLAFAPTAASSRGVLRAEGFSQADTVSRLFTDENLQREAAGQLIWVDEAGLLGAKSMGELFALAERIDARVLLTGDRRQHGAVARGDMLRLLETDAGVPVAEVKDIQRQKDQYKKAVEALSEGRTAEGFDRLDDLGWIREIPGEDRYRQLAADYVDAVSRGRTGLVIAPTHSEARRVTSEIRRLLKEQGLIGGESRKVPMLTNLQLTEAERGDEANYDEGDVLQFHQNAKRYRRGQRVVVDGSKLPLEHASRFTAFRAGMLELAPGDTIRITNNGFTLDGKHRLDNGALYRIKRFDGGGNIVLENGWTVSRDYGHLTHGCVVTSYASQARTVDVTFICQSAESYPASSREQFYVSCSRARESVTIYCDDKQALREAVSQSDERTTATELLHEKHIRDTAFLQRRYHELIRVPAWLADRAHTMHRTREGLTHER